MSEDGVFINNNIKWYILCLIKKSMVRRIPLIIMLRGITLQWHNTSIAGHKKKPLYEKIFLY